MLRSMLNLRGVKVRRITEASDGLGGLSSSSSLTTLSRAAIWQPGTGNAPISDKITRTSTDVLALEYGEYAFTDADREVDYGGQTYRITGHSDNVANRNELLIVGLERLS